MEMENSYKIENDGLNNEDDRILDEISDDSNQSIYLIKLFCNA